MITMYVRDRNQVFSHTIEVDERGPVPNNAFRDAPAMREDKFYVRRKSGWAEVGEYPAIPEREPPSIVIIAPDFVPKGKARRWLIKNGVRPQMVEQEINKIVDETERELALSYWRDQAEYGRHHPLMISIGAVFGFDTEEKLAQAFIAANQEA